MAQQHFLDELGITSSEAFLEYNFAPPILRRNIGILGLIHKRVLGIAHPAFSQLMPWHHDIFGERGPGTHDKQLYNHFMEVHFQYQLYQRSIFSMVGVYNNLSQACVYQRDIKSFQRSLTHIARVRCAAGQDGWMKTFDCRH